MLEAKNLTKTFVRQVTDPATKHRKKQKKRKETFTAVNGVSITAMPGEIFGVLGPNGAGKTTLLRMMGYLMEPTEGEVILSVHAADSGTAFQTEDSSAWQSVITDRTACKKHISYLSENTKLYPRFTVRELLMMIGRLYEYDDDAIAHKIDEVTHVLQMEAFLDNRIDKLSTGQKQRTSIARCLVADPDIYILDEPTLGLDVISAEAIVNFMRQEKQKGKTVLYSTHYMEEAETLCDHVAIIRDGEIVASGAPAELVARTATSNLREAFFAIIGEESEAEVFRGYSAVKEDDHA